MPDTSLLPQAYDRTSLQPPGKTARKLSIFIRVHIHTILYFLFIRCTKFHSESCFFPDFLYQFFHKFFIIQIDLSSVFFVLCCIFRPFQAIKCSLISHLVQFLYGCDSIPFQDLLHRNPCSSKLRIQNLNFPLWYSLDLRFLTLRICHMYGSCPLQTFSHSSRPSALYLWEYK